MDAQVARQLLEAERNRLLRAQATLDHLEVLDDGTGRGSSDLSPSHQHPSDLGSDVFEREKELAILSRVVVELQEVEAAFRRLEAGDYGQCQSCGRPIPDERLEAVPAARFCSEHQDLWEATRVQLTRVPAGRYPDSDADSLYNTAAREALRHLEFLPDDDRLEEFLELGAEEAALHTEEGRRRARRVLAPDQVEQAEVRYAEDAEDEAAEHRRIEDAEG